MENTTNYKKWAFKLLLYIIIINICVAFLPFFTHSLNILVLSIIADILFLTGVGLTIASIKNKEEKDYQYYFSITGYPILIVLFVLITFIIK